MTAALGWREAIAGNLRRLRTHRGWTQGEAAVHAGISLTAYRDLESARRSPRLDTLEDVAAAYRVSPRELLA